MAEALTLEDVPKISCVSYASDFDLLSPLNNAHICIYLRFFYILTHLTQRLTIYQNQNLAHLAVRAFCGSLPLDGGG